MPRTELVVFLSDGTHVPLTGHVIAEVRADELAANGPAGPIAPLRVWTLNAMVENMQGRLYPHISEV